ncbi:hypothetical protein JCM11491_004978 [Sporobolomyces phaffii]
MSRPADPSKLAGPPLPELDDPSDFTFASFQALDSSLRCQICHELFTAPVLLTTCSHTFDSLCLRNHLREIKKCPQCSIEANEDRIRRNLVLEEVVNSWKKSRAHLVSLEALSTVPSPIPIASTSRSHASALPASTASVATRQSLKRKLAQPSPPRRKVKSEPAKTTPPRTVQEEITLLDDDDDDDVDEVAASSDIEVIDDPGMAANHSRGNKRPKREPDTGGTSPLRSSRYAAVNGKGKGKGKGRANEPTGGDPKDPSILVNCPLCQNLVKNGSISPHIDSGCQKFVISRDHDESNASTSRKKKQQENAFGRLMGMTAPSHGGSSEHRQLGSGDDRDSSTSDTTKYLALPNYAFKKLKEIESMLKDLNLPTAVPASHAKTQDSKIAYLKKRHSKYLTLWNANADINPSVEGGGGHKSAKELKEELKRLERVLLDEEKAAGVTTKGNRAAANPAALSSGGGKEGHRTQKAHEGDFKSLIELAKASHEKDKQKREKKQEERQAEEDDRAKENPLEVDQEEEGKGTVTDGHLTEETTGIEDVQPLGQSLQGVSPKPAEEEQVEAREQQMQLDVPAENPAPTSTTSGPFDTIESPRADASNVDGTSGPTLPTRPRTVRIVTPPPVPSPASSSPSPTTRIQTPPLRRDLDKGGAAEGDEPGRRERSSSILEYDEKFFPPTSQRVREVDWDMVRRSRDEDEDEDDGEESGA